MLVAGVSGTLGRAVARHFVGIGWAVSGVTRGPGEFADARSLSDALPHVQITYGDVSDFSVSRRLCDGVDTVVFAMGASGVGASFDDPEGNLLGNALPWLTLLKSARPNTRVVLFSSQLVYGEAKGEPFRETDRARPESPYALHRYLLEEYGRLFASRMSLEVDVLRLGNVFGDVVDTCVQRTHGVVARMLSDLSATGSACLYGDGTQRLELLHTRDLASAIERLAAPLPKPGGYSVFNVHGARHSVREIAEALVAGLGTGTINCVPWDPALRQALAKDVALDDRKFRTEFAWRDRSDVLEELRALGGSAVRHPVAGGRRY